MYVDNIITTSDFTKEDGAIIYRSNLGGEKEASLETGNTIAHPISDNDKCVWINDYYSSATGLYVYDFKQGAYEYISMPDIFSYALVDEYVVVSHQEGLYAYDIVEKKYMELIVSEGTPCGYISQDINEVYAQMWWRDEANKQENVERIICIKELD